MSDSIYVVVTLPTEEDARRFMRASEELEAALPSTRVQMVNLADYVPGSGPPANEIPGGAWCLMGFVHGPDAKDMPDSNLEAGKTAWAAEVVEILESWGLEADGKEEAFS